MSNCTVRNCKEKVQPPHGYMGCLQLLMHAHRQPLQVGGAFYYSWQAGMHLQVMCCAA
jgi:hypothetical protein